MAACGGLEHIFDKPLPESTTILESLSPWKHIKPIGRGDSSFTELFGELHFKESNADVLPHESSSSPSSSMLSSSSSSSRPFPQSLIQDNICKGQDWNITSHRKHHSFSSMNSDSLSLCTEGLGFESSDDVEELLNNNIVQHEERTRNTCTRNSQSRRSRTYKETFPFPPPISCIGRNGKPWVCFKSYRQDGRFILKEVRIPTQEFLHACRENGRLRLQFMSDDDEEILEHFNEEEEEEDNTIEEGNEDANNENDDDVETTEKARFHV